jgi:TLD
MGNLLSDNNAEPSPPQSPEDFIASAFSMKEEAELAKMFGDNHGNVSARFHPTFARLVQDSDTFTDIKAFKRFIVETSRKTTNDHMKFLWRLVSTTVQQPPHVQLTGKGIPAVTEASGSGSVGAPVPPCAGPKTPAKAPAKTPVPKPAPDPKPLSELKQSEVALLLELILQMAYFLTDCTVNMGEQQKLYDTVSTCKTLLQSLLSYRRRKSIPATPASQMSAAPLLPSSASAASEVAGDETISFECFVSWSDEWAAHMVRVLETYVNFICFPSSLSPSFSPFFRPVLDQGSCIVTNECDLLSLGLYSGRLQGSWKRLYTSESDGLSFNRIVHHVLGYDGPTCMLIKVANAEHSVIGLFSADRWKESNRFYGSSESFLFSLSPDLRILRSRSGSNGAYQWLNTSSYGMPHGLGMGGSTAQFRFFIPDSLENCMSETSCLTFEPGRLVPPRPAGKKAITHQNSFEIDSLEIWATGGQALIRTGLGAQAKLREITADNIQKARKCDKAAFFDNSFDQEFLLSGTLQHRAQIQGRDA